MDNEQEIKFYSVAEVSKMLGISRSRTYEWVISPQCPFLVLRIGRRITDGGYDGQDNVALAKEKNVKLVTTALIGKEAPDVLADFEFNEDGTRLLKCAAGHEPVSQTYTKTTRQSEFHLTEIIVPAAHIRTNAAQRFIRRLPRSLPRKMHLTKIHAK